MRTHLLEDVSADPSQLPRLGQLWLTTPLKARGVVLGKRPTLILT